jgi:hypothetical protein
MTNAGFIWGVVVSEEVKLCANPHLQKYLIDHWTTVQDNLNDGNNMKSTKDIRNTCLFFLFIDSFYFPIKMIYYIQNKNPRIMINAYLC